MKKRFCLIVHFFSYFLCIFLVPSSLAVEYEYDRQKRLYRAHDEAFHILYEFDKSSNRVTFKTSFDDYDFDGLSDSLEEQTCTSPTDADTDDDGIPDGVEDANQNGQIDDWDSGETNPCRADTDGDGIQDGTEMGYTSSSTPDTSSVFQPDFHPDSRTDPLDRDSDNDWYSDGDEDANYNGQVDSGESDPTVQDTTDTDGDGLFDALENQICTVVDNADTDGDTILDGTEDSNHNGRRDLWETDPCNADSDNDGLADNVDPEPMEDSYGKRVLPTIILLLLFD